MSSTDQESLLAGSDRSLGLTRPHGYLNGANYNQSRWSKNVLLFVLLGLAVIVGLTLFLYLNLEGNQNDGNRFKPLSRRRPILDHESIFSDSGPSMIRLSDLLAHCIVALKVAGRQVVSQSLVERDKIQYVGSKGKTLEGVDNIVTGVDLASHRIILNTIRDSYRRVKIVSEEDNTTQFEDSSLEDDILPIDRGEFAQLLRKELHEIEMQHVDSGSLVALHETLIWIDPLDATMEYSQNLTEYVTLMACIVHRAKPIAGVIFKPFKNQTYWSMLDAPTGKYHHSTHLRRILNSKPSSVQQKLRVIVSRSHAGNVAQVLNSGSLHKFNIISAGGSGFKTVELIGGTVDAYVHMTHIKKWDICAPHAIIHSIPSGQLTDLGGAEILFGDANEKVVKNGLIASLNHDIHSRLINVFGSPDLKNARM